MMTIIEIKDFIKDNGIDSLQSAYNFMMDDRSHGDDYLAGAASQVWDKIFPDGIKLSEAPKGTEDQVIEYIRQSFAQAEEDRKVDESIDKRMIKKLLEDK